MWPIKVVGRIIIIILLLVLSSAIENRLLSVMVRIGFC